MTISLSIKISTDYLVSHNTVRQILLKLLINNKDKSITFDKIIFLCFRIVDC